MAKPTPPPLKTSRFYCENCGHEVPFNAAICPHCNKIFKAVKCPICSFSGPPDKFLNGCPMCGYLSTTSSLNRKRASEVEENKKMRKAHKKHDLFMPLMGLLLVVLTFALLWVYMTRGQ
ncbi:MAG: hypothetical protein HKM06_08265 [Spirochaetales bacterium]|nr:hypothetical protein [Spirochaetales bacterium]